MNISIAGAQEWWVQNPSTFFFFCLKGTECICVCTFVYAQDSVTHAPLYKSLFLSFFGLSNPNCLFLMADLLLGSVRVPHARYYILWTLERAGQEWKTPCSQNVNCTKLPRWRQMLETNNENELLVPGDFFSTGAENIQLLPIIGQVFGYWHFKVSVSNFLPSLAFPSDNTAAWFALLILIIMKQM